MRDYMGLKGTIFDEMEKIPINKYFWKYLREKEIEYGYKKAFSTIFFTFFALFIIFTTGLNYGISFIQFFFFIIFYIFVYYILIRYWNRKEKYYENLGISHKIDYETEIIHSETWGISRSYSKEDLESWQDPLKARLESSLELGELGLIGLYRKN